MRRIARVRSHYARHARHALHPWRQACIFPRYQLLRRARLLVTASKGGDIGREELKRGLVEAGLDFLTPRRQGTPDERPRHSFGLRDGALRASLGAEEPRAIDAMRDTAKGNTR